MPQLWVATEIMPDPNDKDILAVSRQDVGPILEANKILRSQRQKGDLQHEAQIPFVVLMQWLNDEWVRGNHSLRLYSKEWQELVARKLQDPDWKYLRVDK